MDEKIQRLKTWKEAENLAANAERLGARDLAEAARARAQELRAADRAQRKPSSTRSSSSRRPKGDGAN
jgi:hypothetical protein